ncbi:hypothetical protein [Telluria beijingensis]|uniref:hypothetical protein n=1 Tax=Telluria beijingensis TaxID=3068633 RepID=UPI002795843E|nr:hypothetical protein [Massilia sp. REN29]
MTKIPDIAPSLLTRQRFITFTDAFAVHRKLVIFATFLVLAHCLAMVSRFYLDRDIVFGIVPMFDFYEETNVPTYFSSLNLLLTAAMLLAISRLEKLNNKPDVLAWRVLGLGFLLMSLDEFADVRMILHRAADGISGTSLLDMVPFMTVAWTVPVVLVLAILAVYFVPFLSRLDKRYALHFCLAGACFVLASVVLENTEGAHIKTVGGIRDIPFTIMVTLEESAEIFSILYFQYFLIRYVRQYYPHTGIQVSY